MEENTKMKVLTCENGHYFDTDKYPQCPHCGAGVGSGTKPKTMTLNYSGSESNTEEKPKKEKMKLFGKKKGEPVSKSLEYTASREEYSQSQVSVSQSVSSEPVSSLQSNPNESRTVLLEPVVPQEHVMQRPNASANVAGGFPNTENLTISIADNSVSNERGNSSFTNADREQQISTVNRVNSTSENNIRNDYVAQTVNNVPSAQVYKSVNTSRPSDDVRTVAFYDGDVEPVTGWLVCIEGESYGESFNIKAGRNLIGRSSSMDIALVSEISVSREKQAIIIFEPLKQQFIMQPGEGSSLTYVNDELLLNYVQLAPYDRIRMGNALFLFVPFCCDRFNWSDYPDK